jgi:3-dehydroquinate synthetase
MGLCGPEVTARIVELLTRCELPIAAEGLDAARLLSYLQHDKKFTTGGNRFILLTDIGRWVEQEDVPGDIILEAAESVLG